MKTIINDHNKNILGNKPSINASPCNCRNKEAYPFNGQCQIGKVVYEGTLSRNQPKYKEKSVLELQKNLSRTPIQPQSIF